MKTLWNAIAIFAIANLLGFAGFVGWLIKSDRLNADRVREIRIKLSQTISTEQAKKAEEEAKLVASTKELEKAKKENRPPLTAEEQLSARMEATEIDKQRAERLRSEIATLQASLGAERAKLDSERTALESDRDIFQKAIGSKVTKIEREQFEKTLGILSSLKPSQAKIAFMEILSGQSTPVNAAVPAVPELAAGGSASVPAGDPAVTNPSGPAVTEKGLYESVELLNAMDDRVRNKIMAEFVKDDPKLAAQLLEKIRVRGKIASASEPPKK